MRKSTIHRVVRTGVRSGGTTVRVKHLSTTAAKHNSACRMCKVCVSESISHDIVLLSAAVKLGIFHPIRSMTKVRGSNFDGPLG